MIIGLLLRITGPEVDIGFVPDLEIPLRYLVDAVAFNYMARKCLDQLAPFLIVVWRRGQLLVPECVRRLRCRQLGRHEAQLYERANAIVQEPVVNLIHIREIVKRDAARVFCINSVLVVKDGMKTDIPKAGDLPCRPKVATITLAERQVRAPGSENLLPEVRKGMPGSRGIDNNGLRECGPPVTSA